jgi:hypothetical protein
MAFCNCISLTSVEISSSVADIENHAFSGCDSLEKVTCSRHIKIGKEAFPSCAKIIYCD